ncbi:MAG: YvrJ family protein [Synergistaceae bacterium]
MEEFISSMIQNSFSIAVASYLLVRMEKRMEELTKAVQELSSVIGLKEGNL